MASHGMQSPVTEGWTFHALASIGLCAVVQREEKGLLSLAAWVQIASSTAYEPYDLAHILQLPRASVSLSTKWGFYKVTSQRSIMN